MNLYPASLTKRLKKGKVTVGMLNQIEKKR
jgi:hypothetical protein